MATMSKGILCGGRFGQEKPHALCSHCKRVDFEASEGDRCGELVNPEPEVFGPERADAIWDQRGVQNEVEHAMTNGERAYVAQVWATMAGSTCWDDAFQRIRRGEVPLRVIVLRPQQPPVVEEIAEGLPGLYSICGEPVDARRIGPRYDIWFNDLGRLNNMLANRQVAHHEIYGPFLIARNTEEGDTVSLTDADIEQLLPLAARWEILPALPCDQPSEFTVVSWDEVKGGGR